MSSPETTRQERAAVAPDGVAFTANSQPAPYMSRGRALSALAFFILLLAGFARDLYSLGIYAAGSELHSHIFLIPFISAYLVYIEWGKFPRTYRSSPTVGAATALVGISITIYARFLRDGSAVSENDYLAMMAFAVILFLIAGGFFFLGRHWMRSALFPAAFLLFAIPLPDGAADLLETASKYGSAEAASLFFNLFGTPVVRDGLMFQLPGITLEVAQECSGIRSSWVLLITSVLAAYLFLSTPWRRGLLVFAVIPLGLVRNGFRILVIGMLCVYVGPEMIHSLVHRRGGPLFFVLSLVPLFVLLWGLRRSERRARADEPIG